MFPLFLEFFLYPRPGGHKGYFSKGAKSLPFRGKSALDHARTLRNEMRFRSSCYPLSRFAPLLER